MIGKLTRVLIPLASACLKTTLLTFSEYNRLLFIRYSCTANNTMIRM